MLRIPSYERFFSSHTLVLVLGCILLNFSCATTVIFFHIPLYLDTVGTILGAVLGGYLVGILIGFFSNIINSIVDPMVLYYGFLNIFMGVAAAYLAKRKIFNHLKTVLFSSLPLASIGGGLGGVMTWGLYGLRVRNGISAPIGGWIGAHTNLGPLFSQLVADFTIDVVDKTVVVILVFAVLRSFPRRVLVRLPMGWLFDARAETWPLSAGPDGRGAMKMSSLSSKVAAIITITSFVLSAIAVSISTILYITTTNQRYAAVGRTVVGMMSSALDGDALSQFINDKTVSFRYLVMKSRLERIRTHVREVKFIYVYRITPEGCVVIYDLDTPELAGGRLGELVPFEKSFLPYIPTLLEGGEIPPIVSRGKFGSLLTIYSPIYDSHGRYVACAGTDINMDDVIADRYSFVSRVAMLLFGVSILIVGCSLWYVQKKFVTPINALARATSTFAYDSESHREKSVARFQSLSIRTGDEIENLYKAILKTTTDVSKFIILIDEQSAEVRRKAELITRMQDNIILSFAGMVECRDEGTGWHIRHTAAYVGALAWEMRRRGLHLDILSPEFIQKLIKSAPLHDVGKIKVSDALLNKPGKLTQEEFEVMKAHTTAGGEILREALIGIRDDNYLSEAVNMATYHHERWDGKGYPCGLAGEAIPLSARIMALADVYDALISKRSYKEAYSCEKALEIIKSESGTHFDPLVVETFEAVADEFFRIATSTQD